MSVTGVVVSLVDQAAAIGDGVRARCSKTSASLRGKNEAVPLSGVVAVVLTRQVIWSPPSRVPRRRDHLLA